MMTLEKEEEAICRAALRGDSGAIQHALGRLAGGEEGLIDLDRVYDFYDLDDDDEKTLLQAAAKGGHVEVVQVLLKAGADPNAKNKRGRTPLHYAFLREGLPREDMLKTLLGAGANPNAKDSRGSTPFHWAVQFTIVEIVKLFLKHGADTRAANNTGWAALQFACISNNVEVFQFLLDRGACLNATDNRNRTPLHFACDNGNADAVKCLLAHDEVDVDAKDEYDETPLLLAAKCGYLSIVELLLRRGAGLDATDVDGDTPLHCASYHGYFDIVKALIERGANIFANNNDAKTPLDYAIEEDHIAVINYLLQRYRVTVIHQEGNLCLHLVLRQARYEEDVDDGDFKVMTLPIGTLQLDQMLALLEQFATHCPDCIWAQDTSGQLALHIACNTASPVQVVRFLVERDIDSIRSRDGNGATPLHHACCVRDASIEVLRFLVDQYHTALSLTDSTGSVPLHAACGAGLDLEKIKFLVKEGGVGTLTARDGHGALPLHVLCASKDPGAKVVDYLARQHPKPYPQVLEETTILGDLPIMVACEHSPLSVVYALMRSHPRALINK